MWTYVAIAIGGTLGCWARYAQTNLAHAVFGRDFPLAMLNINVIGSFLMGFLFIVTLERLMIPPSVRGGVLTGVLGGYTTFSTFEMTRARLNYGEERNDLASPRRNLKARVCARAGRWARQEAWRSALRGFVSASDLQPGRRPSTFWCRDGAHLRTPLAEDLLRQDAPDT